MNVCSVDGCDKRVRSNGWCQAHYRRWRKHGDVQADIPIRKRKRNDEERLCTHPGCDRPYKASGYCEAHLQRKSKGKDMDAPIQPRRKHKDLEHCLRPGCDAAPVTNGHCKRHYPRYHQMTFVYGITWEEFDQQWERQEGACAICRVGFSEDIPENIDHCHQEGHVRGLLCAPCNVGLGSFRDDPERLRNAARYLEA